MGGSEQADQRAGGIGRAAQRVDDRDQAKRTAGLTQVPEPGTDPDDGARIEPDIEHELVELVVLRHSAKDARDRTFDLADTAEDRIEAGLVTDFDEEVVNITSSTSQRSRQLLKHSKAEVLEHRDCI